MKPVPLIDVLQDAEHGGKAAQLGAALRSGLPVPPGFALDHVHVEALSGGAAQASVPQVIEAFRALGGPVAVRSSAIGEDGVSASFAGQHATVLGVASPGALMEAIQKVHRSAHAPSALAYRARLGLAGAPRMGVVVQRLVNGDKAGVLFTKNPTTGADERVIEASWGLGEAVVAGLVTPDRFRVARDGRVLERAAGEKDIAIRHSPDGGTREEPVDAERAAALCLTDGELAALERLAQKCEAQASTAIDLEFAFEGPALYLLQQRAVTRSM